MPKRASHHGSARTVLEQRIRQRNQTFEEFAEFAERFARENGEVGSISVRHLQRLVAARRADGQPLVTVRPATARLLERIFGLEIDELLGPPGRAIGMDSDVELRQMLSASSRVDESVIDLLGEQLDAIRRLDRQLGAVVAHDEVTTKSAQVQRLRSFSLSPTVRARLAALQSELCTLAGWQALDMGEQTESWKFYESAKIAASECGDSAFVHHTAAEQAFVLLDIGKNDEAVELLTHVADSARRNSSPLLRAWLLAALGEALAAFGNRSGSLRAFDKSSRILSDNTSDGDGPYVVLDSTHLARWRGHALARLGEPEAVQVLRAALDQLDPSFTRAATGLRVDLATALAVRGERDEARVHIGVAERDAVDIGSVRQRRRIRSLSAVLA
ncbi:hypothetical protein SAMN05192558_109145 [Actinokineospora alba]|uniref:Tetratricopeptide repeat-containing protein n=2 Tax=Actinokineospora alba TaxID=504798 RepID=A0A1H0SYB8_9PSEU|nr:hypothetical protein C8E96_1999 [Actinokineospora alba]SDJ36194.1 hypothetical protein SAMN05421871_1141 [Actinokineospora alba]SDJ52888.1 hypothetical protein SAMN05421871_11859 [Actinokineospora alba]SDP46366.1 hypothetical protein SAMN05192558_109145 [Actinokineospora alba]